MAATTTPSTTPVSVSSTRLTANPAASAEAASCRASPSGTRRNGASATAQPTAAPSAIPAMASGERDRVVRNRLR
ncbi:hypothetical protein [Arthrobacter sp. A5]|uniref:hypothetical protein n=1 Tax=Arthrobacter sp. A5 TaxID=576926 RepID=UPI003DA9875D